MNKDIFNFVQKIFYRVSNMYLASQEYTLLAVYMHLFVNKIEK